jgi:hypothetical protein
MSFHELIPKFQLVLFHFYTYSTTLEAVNVEIRNFLYHQYDLRVLDLSYNNITGMFPSWLLKNNTRLEQLLFEQELRCWYFTVARSPKSEYESHRYIQQPHEWSNSKQYLFDLSKFVELNDGREWIHKLYSFLFRKYQLCENFRFIQQSIVHNKTRTTNNNNVSQAVKQQFGWTKRLTSVFNSSNLYFLYLSGNNFWCIFSIYVVTTFGVRYQIFHHPLGKYLNFHDTKQVNI